VLRVDPSNRPVLVLALGAEEPSDPTPAQLIDLKRLAEDVVARRLEQLEGVARVRVTGGYEREIEVQVQADRMAAYSIDLSRIETALRDANVSLAGGTIQKGPFRYAVEVSGEFRDVNEVAATVVSPRGKPPVRLAEVARVEEGVARRRGLVRFDGREVLLLLVERRPDANTVETAAEARKVVEELRRDLPGVRLEPVVDESVFIEAAIDGVVQALLWGGLLAVVVLLAFLRRPRLLAAVAVAVPLSLALALVLFDLLGITLNLISLSGLALGVGLLVDNAIVVVENIARLREKGLTAHQAAAEGAAEVAGAITASTLTTLAVFLPLTFVEGLAGRLFRDQSLAVACSVGASLLVAVTVVPLIASRDRRGAFTTAVQGAPGLGFYEKTLSRCMARPGWVMVGVLGFLVITGGLALRLPREVVPETDEGRLEVALTLPPDADLGLVAARSREVEAALRAFPEVEHLLADLGERDDARLDLEPRPPYEGEITVVLQAGATSRDLLRRISHLPAPPDLAVESRAVRTQLEDLLVSGESDLVLDLLAEDRAQAEAAVPALLSALAARPELANAVRGDPEGIPAYDLQFDRDALARLGARAEALDGYLEAAARGREATRLHRMREEVPIVLRASVGSVEELLAERLPTAAGMLPVSTFVKAEPVSLPAVLLRHGQAPVVRLLVDLAPGVDLSKGVAAVEAALEATVPPAVRSRVGGANQAFHDSLRAVGWSLLLSVLLVYLILAAQFESLIQPLVVLSVVPLAIGGVTLALAVTGQSWNLMSLTGCVVLVGIAVNDAIVKVDFINRRQRDGLPLDQAIHQAGHDRFRPIVMTTVTTALGLLPLAMGWGAGGSLRAPLAIAIVGGLGVATVLTLVVVPVVARIKRSSPTDLLTNEG
jgi:HAE1 family hydrophobic/amphiphilic exporter-1